MIINPFTFGAAAPDIYTYGPKVAYDISDTATLFQDSAGTTPVTADGDPVGLVLNQIAGYTNADMMQATAGSRPIYRTSGGKAWLENDGTKWMYSRSAGALAFAIVNTFAGARKTTGFADFGAIVGHPHATTHTSPFWRWCIQGRTSGPTVGAAVDSGALLITSSSAAAAIGTDFILTCGTNSMWDASSASQRSRVLKVSKGLPGATAVTTTTTYVNSNVSTLMSHAAGVVPFKGNFYGAVIFDIAVTSQAWVDAGEAWVNARLQVPV
jgi:hypothetical protein